jgi:arylsulfatase A-like enzyme
MKQGYFLNLHFPEKIKLTCYLLLFFSILTPQINHAATETNTPACKQCNVLLLNIDFLRSDYVGPLKNKPLTPNIDKFFQGGMIFKNIYSPSGSTYRGNLSVFTATNPFFYNLDVKTFETLRSKNEFKRWRNIYSSQTTLAEKMQSAGYHTVMLNKGTRSGKRTMLDRGYTKYKQFPLRTLIEDQIDHLLKELDSAPKPFFIHLHAVPTRLHRAFYPQKRQRVVNEDILYFPYQLKGKPYGYKVIRNQAASAQRQRQAEHTIYQQQLKYADDQLKRIFDYMSNKMDDTVVILVSTHGTQIGDKGVYASNGVSYESNIRVPLMIRIPGITFSSTIDARLSLLDLMPSILKLLDFPDSHENTDNLLTMADNKSSYHRPFIAGHNDKDSYIIKDNWKLFLKTETTRSLHKLQNGEPVGDNIFKRNRLISLNLEFSENQGFDLNIKRQSKNLLFNKTTLETPELYNLSKDPLEKTNLASQYPQKTSELLALLQQYRLQAKIKIDQLNYIEKPLLLE